MNLPDINEMYPQREELTISRCIRCRGDIMRGYECVSSDAYDFCSMDCFIEQALEDGTLVIKIAGEQ